MYSPYNNNKMYCKDIYFQIYILEEWVALVLFKVYECSRGLQMKLFEVMSSYSCDIANIYIISFIVKFDCISLWLIRNFCSFK